MQRSSRLIFSRQARRPSWIFRKIEQDNCFIIQHIGNKAQFYCRKAGDDLCHFSPRHAKLPISPDICYLRTTSIQCTTITIGQSCNVLNNVHVLRAEKVARNSGHAHLVFVGYSFKVIVCERIENYFVQ